MSADVLIVGAGLIGLATGYEFSRAGYQVLILDRGLVGQESSWAGGGILFPLMPWDYAEPVNILAEYSLSLYHNWTEQLFAEGGVDPELIQSGLVHLFPYDMHSALSWINQRGMRCEIVNPQEIVSDLLSETEALWFPDVYQVRNPRLTQSLKTVLEKRGVQIVERVDVTGLIARNSRIIALETSSGQYKAGSYVITGGAWSQSILGAYALNLSIRPVRGQMLLFKDRPSRLKQIIYHQGTYIIPRKDGHVLTGSTLEEVGFDKNPTSDARENLFHRATDLLPWLRDSEFVQQWAGLRPGSPQSIPVIDRHPLLSNLYVNTGHFRYGVTMAPGSAKLLVSRFLDQEAAISLKPYVWPHQLDGF
ncbi:MAG: glycine oxidase ThiO [Proteobacteria bacterium]|nr:glycine oxidase ThiO [Pseudomonadota bacterium]MDE3208658.1 glycine oxidase ThiO [Pseudomonadota bacterium]